VDAQYRAVDGAVRTSAMRDVAGTFRSPRESSYAALCASSPVKASSGKTRRQHRLNRGGDRHANSALWTIVLSRMSNHQPTRDYVERRTKEGLSKPEIMRCLKRYVAREVFPQVRAISETNRATNAA
jgi:transposase